MRAPGDAWVRDRLIAGTAALFGLRLVLSLVRTGPLVVADEIGYLTNARVLSGGLPGQLTQAEFYRGGYSLLLTPLLKLSHDPSTAYHLVLALNAVLAASLVPLLYLLLTRCASVAPRTAVWAALAGAAYPSVTIYSQLALSENALFPLVCLWLLAVGALLKSGSASRDWPRQALPAAGAGACAAALWAVHGSMVVAPVLTVALGGWLLARRRIDPRVAAVLVIVLGVGLLGAHVLDDYLVAHNYGGHAQGGANDRLSALEAFHPILTALGNLAGQLWYLLVATFGLAGVLIAWLAAPGSRGRDGRELAFWLLALTVLLAFVSAGAFPTRTRPDMLIYGRYLEVVAPPLVAFGVALVAERRVVVRVRAIGAGLAGLTLLVVLVRVTAANPGSASRFNVASLPFLTFQLGAGVLVGAAVVAGTGAWIIARASARAGLLTLALFVPVVAYGEWNPVIQTQRSEYPSGWTSPGPVASRLGIRTVGYDLSAYDEIGLYVTQWFLPDTRVVLFDGTRRTPPSQYVISGSSWPRRHPSTALWTDNGRDQLLWRLKPAGG